MSVLLQDQIAAVEREIGFRVKLYPRWVAQNKLTQAAADQEIARMRAVRDTLASVQVGAPVLDQVLDEAGIRRSERLRVLECLNQSFPFGVYSRIEARIRAKMGA